jgi:predicted NACHT family NTPase
LERHGAVEGWIIAAQRKSSSACELAARSKKVFCYTFDELIEERADFRKYFNRLEDHVKKQRIDTDYIPLACRRELYNEVSGEKTGEERYGGPGGIEGYIDRWLEDPCKEHISILGEFGTGKT